MIEIFKTTVKSKEARKQVLAAMREALPGVVATLDLDDNDKILRVVGVWAPIHRTRVIEVLKQHGYECELISD
jgi:hypothetical protein